LFLDLND